uniref:Uncharacterized protein n=1 Tax=Amazona collaria TaxID=241587 RepID=A0A8B9IUL7_9PSIT
MIGFSEGLSPLKKPRNNLRLDISPLQATSVPTALQRESSTKLSPKTASSYKLFVPVVSFYSKEKCYLTPYERKELNEHHRLGERNRDEHLPAASRTEKMNMSLSRNKSLKPTKHTTKSKHGKTVRKAPKKVKRETSAEKSRVEKENVNSVVKKKMESPFRVLSMTVKPALKLQLGAAFFSAGKKSHSKNSVNQGRDAACDGKASPLKSESASGPSYASRSAARGESNAENVVSKCVLRACCTSLR